MTEAAKLVVRERGNHANPTGETTESGLARQRGPSKPVITARLWESGLPDLIRVPLHDQTRSAPIRPTKTVAFPHVKRELFNYFICSGLRV